jgi:hypothetical protein
VREVSGKIRTLISAIALLFSAQLVLFNPTIFEISALLYIVKIYKGAYLSPLTSRSGWTIIIFVLYVVLFHLTIIENVLNTIPDCFFNQLCNFD